MTKTEMVMAILEYINWGPATKEYEAKDAVRKNSKERIEKVYNYFIEAADQSDCVKNERARLCMAILQ